MDPVWVRSIRDQCLAAGVAFFFKQWGGPRPKSRGRTLDGRTWDEYPEIHPPLLPLLARTNETCSVTRPHRAARSGTGFHRLHPDRRHHHHPSCSSLCVLASPQHPPRRINQATTHPTPIADQHARSSSSMQHLLRILRYSIAVLLLRRGQLRRPETTSTGAAARVTDPSTKPPRRRAPARSYYVAWRTVERARRAHAQERLRLRWFEWRRRRALRRHSERLSEPARARANERYLRARDTDPALRELNPEQRRAVLTDDDQGMAPYHGAPGFPG